MKIKVPIGVSARHIHLSHEVLEQLFGRSYELTSFRPLSQPCQFAAEETLTLLGPKGQISKVRILGPLRERTQVEISMTDAIVLGIKPPVRESGNLDGTPDITLLGPKGTFSLESGVIIAARHIHFHTSDAKCYGIQDKDFLNVNIGGARGCMFHHVIARVSDEFHLEMHIDTDEANASGVKTGDFAEII
jgi:putative phosphotransacetylase